MLKLATCLQVYDRGTTFGLKTGGRIERSAPSSFPLHLADLQHLLPVLPYASLHCSLY